MQNDANYLQLGNFRPNQRSLELDKIHVTGYEWMHVSDSSVNRDRRCKLYHRWLDVFEMAKRCFLRMDWKLEYELD